METTKMAEIIFIENDKGDHDECHDIDCGCDKCMEDTLECDSCKQRVRSHDIIEYENALEMDVCDGCYWDYNFWKADKNTENYDMIFDTMDDEAYKIPHLKKWAEENMDKTILECRRCGNFGYYKDIRDDRGADKPDYKFGTCGECDPPTL